MSAAEPHADRPHRLPRARRGRGRDVRAHRRAATVADVQAAHLRAAALLRGVPARPRVHRGARHHRADLRHLPGRLPDERGAGDGGRVRRRDRRRPDPRPAPAASTAASGSRATRCTSTCCTRPTSSATTSAIEMARDHREIVERGLQMKKAGNALMTRRRRARDPPDQRARRRLLPRADAGRAARAGRPARARARDRARDRALDRRRCRSPTSSASPSSSRSREPGEYPIDRGRIVSDRGLDIAPARVRRARRRGARRALQRAARAHPRARQLPAGPLARYSLDFDALSAARARGRARGRARADVPQPVPEHRRAQRRAGAGVRRGARDHRRATSRPTRRRSRSSRAAAVGHGATEAPRGLLYHRYEIDDDGTILDARIVPPTSQNQRAIEEDLRAVVAARTSTSPTTSCALRCEQAIRNHDPCISCATHFLDLDGRAWLSAVLVIGVGNALRGDDGAGLGGRARLRERGVGGASSTRASRSALLDAVGGRATRSCSSTRALRRRARHRPPPRRRAPRRCPRGCAARRRRTRSASPRRSSSRARSAGCPARLVVYGDRGRALRRRRAAVAGGRGGRRRVAAAVRSHAVCSRSAPPPQ